MPNSPPDALAGASRRLVEHRGTPLTMEVTYREFETVDRGEPAYTDHELELDVKGVIERASTLAVQPDGRRLHEDIDALLYVPDDTPVYDRETPVFDENNQHIPDSIDTVNELDRWDASEVIDGRTHDRFVVVDRIDEGNGLVRAQLEFDRKTWDN